MKRVWKRVVVIAILLSVLTGMIDVIPGVNTTVNVEAASSIKLNKSKATIYVGNTVKLKLSGATADSVKWSSSDDKIAKVSNGKVTGLKKGSVTITAKYNKKSYKCKVTVKSAKISYKSLTLREGYGFNLEVLNSEGKVTWTSSKTSVAKINKNGFISPFKTGTTKITAKVGSESYVCNLKVVSGFTEEDFVFDDPTEEGYTNFIDYSTGKGSNWYWYFSSVSDTDNKMNRGINIGDTYDQFIAAYGYCENIETVGQYDKYREHFNNATYPRTKISLSYKDNLTQNYYYKSFYFDRNGTVVLIIWHR